MGDDAVGRRRDRAGEAGRLDRTGGHHHVLAPQRPTVGRDHEAVTGAGDVAHRGVQADARPQGRGQLRRERLHARGGQAGIAGDEGGGQQPGEGGRGGTGVVEEDPGEEALEHATQRARQPGGVQGRGEGGVGSRGDRVEVTASGPVQQRSQPAQQPREVAQVAADAAQGPSEQSRRAQRVSESQQTLLGQGCHACLEGAESQCVGVDPAAYGGIGRVEQLEAAVDLEPVDAIGADAATHVVSGLDDQHLASGADQLGRAAQSGQAGTHDDDVGIHGAASWVAQPRGAAST